MRWELKTAEPWVVSTLERYTPPAGFQSPNCPVTLYPTCINCLEGERRPSRAGVPAEGLQVEAVRGEPDWGWGGGCLATPQLSVDLEEAALS